WRCAHSQPRSPLQSWTLRRTRSPRISPRAASNPRTRGPANSGPLRCGILSSLPTASHIRQVLDDLAAFCQANDARETERERRMLSITSDTGQLLSILVRATRARRILELGTSSGY